MGLLQPASGILRLLVRLDPFQKIANPSNSVPNSLNLHLAKLTARIDSGGISEAM